MIVETLSPEQMRSKISRWEIRVHMPDGSTWAVPAMIVARDRAKAYKDEFGGDVEKSLDEDTLPCIIDSTFELNDWAANNMNWTDVKQSAYRVADADPVDWQEGWCNGEKEVYDTGKPIEGNT